MSVAKRARIAARAAVGLLAVLCACGSEKPPGDGDEYEAVLWPSTHVIDEAAGAQVAGIAEDRVTFAAGSSVAASLARNHVLLAGRTGKTPEGMLRRVTAVEPAPDGTIVVRTRPAVLQHAFQKLHVKATRPVDLASPNLEWKVAPGTKVMGRSSALSSVSSAASGGEGFGPFTLDYYPFNGDGDPSTPEDQVHVTATMGGGVYYQLGIDLEWPDVAGAVWDVVTFDWDELDEDLLPEVKAGFDVSADSHATLDVDGMVTKAVEREDILAHENLGVVCVAVFCFTVTVDLLSRIEGGATSRFHVKTGASASFKMAAQFSTKEGGKLIPPTPVFEIPSPEVEIPSSARVRVQVGPRLLVALYGLVGPHATMWSYGELNADLAQSPCWSLAVGLSGDVGVSLALFGVSLADWSEPFDLASVDVLTGSCKEDVTVTQSPDLSEPSFESWSERLEDTAAAWTSNDDHVGLAQATDGAWLLSGSRLRTLAKADNDGRLLWARAYQVPDAVIPMDLNVTSAVNTLDAGILATMHSPSLVALMNADGGVLWAVRPALPFQANLGPKASLEAPDGSFWVAGTFAPTDMGKTDVWLARLDRDGNLLWARQWGLADRTEFPTALLAVEGDVLLVGQTFGLEQDPAQQSFAMRLAPDATVKWSRDLAGCPLDTGGLRLRTALLSRDGDLVLGGAFGLGSPRSILVKLKPDGAVAWWNGADADVGGLNSLDLTGVVQLTDGGYLETGTWWTGGTDHLWVARTDSVGRLLWLEKIEDGHDNGLPAVGLTGKGGALVAAYTSAGDDGSGLWLSRLGVKTGALSLDAAAGTVSAQPYASLDSPCMTLHDGTVPLVPMDLALTPQALLERAVQPVITKLITR